jgi:hypothetical protein
MTPFYQMRARNKILSSRIATHVCLLLLKVKIRRFIFHQNTDLQIIIYPFGVYSQIRKNSWSLFTLTSSGVFPLDSLRASSSSYIVFPHSNLVQVNFPYPLVILRHWRDLDATTTREKKKAFAPGLNGGKRSRRTP